LLTLGEATVWLTHLCAGIPAITVTSKSNTSPFYLFTSASANWPPQSRIQVHRDSTRDQELLKVSAGKAAIISLKFSHSTPDVLCPS